MQCSLSRYMEEAEKELAPLIINDRYDSWNVLALNVTEQNS